MGSRATTTSQAGSDLGFTLIELILVSAVLGILLVASLPRFQQTARLLRVEQQAIELTQRLRYARELAVSTGHEVVWVWDPSERRARLLELLVAADGATSGSWIADQPEVGSAVEERAVLAPPDYEESPIGCPQEAPPEAACVYFFPNGTSESVGLTLQSPAQAYTIRLDGTTSKAVRSERLPAR